MVLFWEGDDLPTAPGPGLAGGSTGGGWARALPWASIEPSRNKQGSVDPGHGVPGEACQGQRVCVVPLGPQDYLCPPYVSM